MARGRTAAPPVDVHAVRHLGRRPAGRCGSKNPASVRRTMHLLVRNFAGHGRRPRTGAGDCPAAFIGPGDVCSVLAHLRIRVTGSGAERAPLPRHWPSSRQSLRGVRALSSRSVAMRRRSVAHLARTSGPPPKTRAGATPVALLLIMMLIILILQNQNIVDVRSLSFTGSIPPGTALLVAAVTGGAVVTIVGVIRLTQLRLTRPSGTPSRSGA